MSENCAKKGKARFCQLLRNFYAHTWVKLAIAFVLPIFTFLLAMLALNLVHLPKTVFFQDVNIQYLDFLNFYRDLLQGQADWTYSLSLPDGGAVIPLLSYYLLSPFNLITLFFTDTTVNIAFFVIVLLKIGTIGATAFYFAKHNFKSDKLSYLFSFSFALCSYVLCYFFHFEWLDAVILLPLICLGLQRLVNEQKILLYVLSLGAAIFINYYTGFMLCIFSVFWFAFQAFNRFDGRPFSHQNRKSALRLGGRFVVSSLLAGGLAAVVLLPTLSYIFTSTSRAGGEIFSLALKYRPYEIFGQLTTNQIYGFPYIFAGILIFLLLFCFFINRKINKKFRISAGVFLAIMLISTNVFLLNALWHGGTIERGAPYRYSFCVIFLILYLGMIALENIRGISKKQMFRLLIVLIVGCLFAFLRDLTVREGMRMYMDIFLLLFFGVGLLIIAKKIEIATKWRRRMPWLMAAAHFANVWIFAFFTMTFLVTVEGAAPSFNAPSGQISYVEGMSEVKELDNGLYRTEKTFMHGENDGLTLDLNTLSAYYSTSDKQYSNLRKRLGLGSGGHDMYHINFGSHLNDGSIDNGTLPMAFTNNFFGVKYIGIPKDSEINLAVAAERGYELVLDEGNYGIYKNDLALPLGFVVPQNVADIDLAGDISGGYSVVEGANTVARVAIDEDVLNEVTNYEYSVHGLIENEDQGLIYDGYTNGAYVVYAIQNPEKRPVYLISDGFFNGDIYDLTKTDDNGEPLMIGSSEYRLHYLGSDAKIEIRIQIADYKSSHGIKVKFAYEDLAASEKLANHWAQTSTCESARDSEITCQAIVDDEDSVLLFTLAYDKGWHAYVDGEPVEIAAGLGAMVAVPLSKGAHTVKIIYQPRGLLLGGIITLLSFVVLVVSVVVGRKKSNQAHNLQSNNKS